MYCFTPCTSLSSGDNVQQSLTIRFENAYKFPRSTEGLQAQLTQKSKNLLPDFSPTTSPLPRTTELNRLYFPFDLGLKMRN